MTLFLLFQRSGCRETPNQDYEIHSPRTVRCDEHEVFKRDYSPGGLDFLMQ